MVLTGGAACAPLFPSFFSFLPFNKQAHQTTPLPLSTGLTAARRAQSVSGLTSKTNELDPEFRAFEAECAQHEAHRTGLMHAPEFTMEPSRAIYPGLGGVEGARQPKVPTRTQPLHPHRARRIQSAPCVQLGELPSLLEDGEAWEIDQATLNNEFIVPSVKAKAAKTPKGPVCEAWDDDFDTLSIQGDELVIPDYLQPIQVSLKLDMAHIRRFDLHVQGFCFNLDLKLVYLDALDLEAGVREQDAIKADGCIQRHQPLIEKIRVVLELAEFKENELDQAITSRHVAVLGDILRDSPYPQVSKMLTSGQVDFGHDFLTLLLERMAPIKNELLSYVGELRQVAMSMV